MPPYIDGCPPKYSGSDPKYPPRSFLSLFTAKQKKVFHRRVSLWSNQSFSAIFSTATGSIRDVARRPEQHKFCVIEEIKLPAINWTAVDGRFETPKRAVSSCQFRNLTSRHSDRHPAWAVGSGHWPSPSFILSFDNDNGLFHLVHSWHLLATRPSATGHGTWVSTGIAILHTDIFSDCDWRRAEIDGVNAADSWCLSGAIIVRHTLCGGPQASNTLSRLLSLPHIRRSLVV